MSRRAGADNGRERGRGRDGGGRERGRQREVEREVYGSECKSERRRQSHVDFLLIIFTVHGSNLNTNDIKYLCLFNCIHVGIC